METLGKREATLKLATRALAFRFCSSAESLTIRP